MILNPEILFGPDDLSTSAGNTVLFIYKCTVVTGYSVIHVELSLQVYLIHQENPTST
jgi:hypothetical protein